MYTKERIIKTIIITIILLIFTGLLRISNISHLPINIFISPLIYTIYITMLFLWGISIFTRILNKNIRSHFISIALLMFFWIFVRTMKHITMTEIENVSRFLWYLYYIPMIFIPLHTFFSGLCLGKPEDWRASNKYYYLFVPASLLTFLVLANDYHQLVFKFNMGFENWEIYTYGIGYFIVCSWMGLLFISLIILLFKKSYMPRTKKWIWAPFAVLGIMAIYSVLYWIDKSKRRFGFIELTAMICTLVVAFLESLIQSGLIPSNKYHDEFFKFSPMGAIIVDEEGEIFYSSKDSEFIDEDTFKEVKSQGHTIDKNFEIHISNISGGYVIWKEDISEILNIINELENTKSELMDGISILKENFQVKNKRSDLERQIKVYNLTAEQSQIEKIKSLIDLYEKEDADGKNKVLWLMNILGTYIKRRVNMSLILKTTDAIRTGEFFMALKESMDSIALGNVDCDIYKYNIYVEEHNRFVDIYDFFEKVIEAFLPSLEYLHVGLEELNRNLTIEIKIKTRDDFSPNDRVIDEIIQFVSGVHLQTEDDNFYISACFVR